MLRQAGRLAEFWNGLMRYRRTFDFTIGRQIASGCAIPDASF
jgi:hypothetical protein